MNQDLVQEWMKNDPYLMDAEGFQKFLEQKMAEALEAQKPKPKPAPREKAVSYRPESQQWFKDLEELADRRYGGRDLASRIHEEILVRGEQFTQENAAAFQEGIELLGKLMMIHHDYVETQEKVWGEQEAFGGKWGDMFGDWLSFTGQLNTHAGQFLTPPNIAHFIAKMCLGDKEELEKKTALICDPACGTGRFMLDTAEHYAETIGKLNFVFVNIDIEFKVYVYCTMNAILNGIPSVIIWGDSLGLVEDYNEAVVTIPIGSMAMWKVIQKDKIPETLARLKMLNT